MIVMSYLFISIFIFPEFKTLIDKMAAGVYTLYDNLWKWKDWYDMPFLSVLKGGVF